jgi:hypothetical protein
VTAPYRLHFGAIYAALGLVLGAAIATTIVLLVRDGPAEPPLWSTWRPVGDTDAKVSQISSFVSDEYKLPSGAQFAVVRAGAPTDQGVPVASYVIRRATATQGNSFDTVSAKNSIVYTLSVCGLTQDCTKLSRPQAAAVTQTLRRQALELALYTFEYAGDVSSVMVDLPALSENGASPAVFLQRSDVAAQIDRPLRFTLTPQAVFVPGLSTAAEARRIDALTVAHIYQHNVTQDPSGAPVIVLDPIQP